MGVQGSFALSYTGVSATNPPQFVVYQRAPTTGDWQNFNIGTIWEYQIVVDGNPPTYDTSKIYILVATAQQIGTWVEIGGNSSSFVRTLTGDSGGAVSPYMGNITLAGGSGITVTGTPMTNTLTIAASGGSGNIVTTSYETPGATGTHTLNASTSVVEVFAWGGGNSGAGGYSSFGGLDSNGGRGGGGGGYFHYISPVAAYGGAGSGVSYSVANTVAGAAPGVGSGTIGDVSSFGNLTTPTTSPAQYPLPDGTEYSIGGGCFDNASFTDFTWYAQGAPGGSQSLFTPFPFLGHNTCNAVGSSFTVCYFPSLGGGGGDGVSFPPDAGGNGGSIGSTDLSTILVAGGSGNTGGDGAPGNPGGMIGGFMCAGSGGGGGSIANANGGDGGWPAGGGGGGASNTGNTAAGGSGGAGAGGWIYIIEYLS